MNMNEISVSVKGVVTEDLLLLGDIHTAGPSYNIR